MRSVSRFRRSAVALAICLLAGHALAAARPARRIERWQAVLVAGDDAEPVFDDATRAMAARLLAAGVPAGHIHRLSASKAQLRKGGSEPATIPRLLRLIGGLNVRPGEQCLIFLTSHGERGAGLWLARSDAALRPGQLAGALSQGCGAAPTVVIVSGCYTGGFAQGAMARPNRIVLTAARADRPSFGCQAGRKYTFFDGCLLAALRRSGKWGGVFGAAKACVARLEYRLGERPSEPQAYFGAAVADLGVGF